MFAALCHHDAIDGSLLPLLGCRLLNPKVAGALDLHQLSPFLILHSIDSITLLKRVQNVVLPFFVRSLILLLADVSVSSIILIKVCSSRCSILYGEREIWHLVFLSLLLE